MLRAAKCQFSLDPSYRRDHCLCLCHCRFHCLFLVRSSPHITLIKFFKGHWSLELLCCVVKAVIVSGSGPTKGQTMSPIELFWTAKNVQDIMPNGPVKDQKNY